LVKREEIESHRFGSFSLKIGAKKKNLLRAYQKPQKVSVLERSATLPGEPDRRIPQRSY
jgi:hypothetical protein